MPELSGMIQEFLEGSIKSKGRTPVVNALNVSENGTYTPESGVDGFNPVVVNVPDVPPVIDSLSIFGNGTYEAPEGIDGYSPIIVDVPQKIETTLNVTENGTYTPAEGYAYNGAIVNVPIFNPPKNILYTKFQENDMLVKIGLYGDINTIWNGNNSQIGATIQGTTDIGQFNTIKVKGIITNSFAKVNNNTLPRTQFVVGVTDEVFNNIILVDYNTSTHIIAREDITLYDKGSEVSINFDLDISEINSGYFFVSLLGITIENLELEFI